MRELILQSQVSADGFMASLDGSTDWMVWDWGPDWTWDAELQQHHTDVILSAETILMSSKDPHVFIEHWQQIARDEDAPTHAFAHHLGHGEKVIFSRIEREAPWENTTVISGDMATEVTKLKKRPGGPVLAFGGAVFASALLAAGVVDVLHLFVNPVAIGHGMPMFNQIEEPLNLELIETRAFGDGMHTVQYGVRNS
jgi:dihydrofolate reductase